MTETQYNMLLQDSANVKKCIAMLQDTGETDRIANLMKKLSFLERHIENVVVI